MATLLIVTDDLLNHLHLLTTLQTTGHRLLEASSGEQALLMAETEPLDLVISGLMMPDIDGLEMAFRMRALLPNQHPAFIFSTSAYSAQELRQLAHLCGVFHILPERAAPGEIIRYVDSALSLCPPPIAKSQYETFLRQHKILLRDKLSRMMGELKGESLKRMRAEQTLESTMDSLEARIEERTRELHHTNMQLNMLALHDGLTGLKNHRAFREQMEREVERNAREETSLSLLMFDVDCFKQYNDTFGHPAGDTVLKRIAQLLAETARTEDFPARYGGEEFAVILPGTDKKEALFMAEQFRRAIASESWQQRAITASIGVALLKHDAFDSSELIARADKALYAAKHGGRNRVVFYDDSAEEDSSRFLGAVISAREAACESRQPVPPLPSERSVGLTLPLHGPK